MLTPSQSKLLNFAVQIRETEYEPEKAFISREMVQATLPHRNPGDIPAWSRVNGNYALVIQPGWDSWKNQSFGYPYGTIPRLLIFWLMTEALKTGSRRLEVGGSLAEFMGKLGLDSSRGGKRSDAARLRDQMERLFRARISFEYRDDEQASWHDLQIASKGMMWWHHNLAEQPTLWENWVELSEDFFRAVTAHPIPVDMNALQRLKGLALALDLYAWLTHESFRSNARKKARKVSWRSLHNQFGAEYSDLRNFSRKMMEALNKVKIVFPGLEVETFKGGIAVKPGQLAVSAIKTASAPRKLEKSTLPTSTSSEDKGDEIPESLRLSAKTLGKATELMQETDWDIADMEEQFYNYVRSKGVPKDLGRAFLGFVRKKIQSES
ncbi:MAG: plasmid encoded RepA protein [Leptolyngbya sp. SIO4C5]|nr:plasmid encoded RepA protein [Leptolyngbya sp. SIO4C5]